MWILPCASEDAAEKLVLEPSAPKHNRAAALKSCVGTESSRVNLGGTLYSPGVILFEKMGVNDTEKKET